MARYPDADLQQVSVSLRPETIEVAESLQRESQRRPEMWDMSRSEAIREVIQAGIEAIGDDPDVSELIDDGALSAYQRQKRHEDRRRAAEIADLLGGWRGRVSRRFNYRLAGDEPYPPEHMETLAESYFGDVADLCDDADELQAHRDWLDEKIERYRNAYDVKKLAPRDTFEDRDEKVSTGADLWKLREDAEQVVADLVGAIQSDHADPDALVTKVSKEWGVDEPAVWTVLDMLIPETEDARQALIGPGGRDMADLVNPDRTELLEPETPVSEYAIEEPPEPETPELTDEPATTSTDEHAGISDGGIVTSPAVEPDDQDDRGDEPDEELVEQAVEMIQDDDPTHNVEILPQQLPASEEVAREATHRAFERIQQ